MFISIFLTQFEYIRIILNIQSENFNSSLIEEKNYFETIFN